MDLNNQDRVLIEEASQFLKQNYQQGRHHVACSLRAGDNVYTALHLDTKGLDVCAEPIALSNALKDGHSKFDIIVAVTQTKQGEIKVIAPCGNCRQILFEYAPDAQVIVPVRDTVTKQLAKSLLPYPYS